MAIGVGGILAHEAGDGRSSLTAGVSVEAMWTASSVLFVSRGGRLFYQDAIAGSGAPNVGAQAVIEMGLYNWGVEAFIGVTNRGLRVGGGIMGRIPLGNFTPARPYIQCNLSVAYQGNLFAPSAPSGAELSIGLHTGVDFDL